MPDSLLILTPLLVLAVVLALSFAGCGFEAGVATPDPDPPPDPTLTFRARVPTAVTVTGPVTFSWTRPTATTPETMAVTSPTTAGADDVYEHPIPSPEAGGWLGRCTMTVQASDVSGVVPEEISVECPFTWPPEVPENKVLLFVAETNPFPPPTFRVVCQGLNPA